MDRGATIPPLSGAPAVDERPLVAFSVVPWTPAAAVISSVVLAVLLFACVQRSAMKEILTLGETMTPGPEPWLLPLAVVSTTLIVLLPGVLLAGGLAWARRRRASRVVFITLSSLVLALILVDIDLLRSIGRHVGEILAVALQPHGHVAGGELRGWLVMLAQWFLLAMAGTTLVSLVCERLVAALSAALTPFWRRIVAAAGALGLLTMASGPIVALQAWRNTPVVERLYANGIVDPRGALGAPADQGNLDPGLQVLYPRMRDAYRAAFAGITTGKPADPTPLSLPARSPNVVLIVTESFRHDVFGPELMPRMSRWAENGLVAARHDSGTMYSQSGMFALLYGRSPALFHQTLDMGVPPQLCVTLRSSGYECAYFTGHPKEWMRREEYLNERTMDRFVHDDRGTWPEWDERALDGMVQLVNTSEKPVFAIVLLMSSHFEYQYPPRYEIDRPVSDTVWRVTTTSTLGPEAELPHRNRYRNCMRFIDDVVANAVERLDPAKNLVVFTGDHGESINDDGRYTHGYSFAEIITRTPLAMVGPGVQPMRLDTPTSHVDVLPSVLHALTGESRHVAHTQGIDWLAGEHRTLELETHSRPTRETVQSQLRWAGHRLRLDFELSRPSLTLLGFENELGLLMPTPQLSEQDAIALAGAFGEELGTLRK